MKKKEEKEEEEEEEKGEEEEEEKNACSLNKNRNNFSSHRPEEKVSWYMAYWVRLPGGFCLSSELFSLNSMLL